MSFIKTVVLSSFGPVWTTLHGVRGETRIVSQLGEFIEVFSVSSLGDISVRVSCLPRVKKVVALLRVDNPR